MVNYPMHKIVYTDMNKDRVVAFVSEDSSKLALILLEETLEKLGYSDKSIQNMLPVSRETEYEAPSGQIEFRGKVK